MPSLVRPGVGQPILAAAGFQPALQGTSTQNWSAKPRLQARLPAPHSGKPQTAWCTSACQRRAGPKGRRPQSAAGCQPAPQNPESLNHAR
jgi:hypothetical protein